jgi:DNA-3-methyladenine glycosylase II
MALMPAGTPPTPEALASVSDEQFRTVGMSRQKSAYLRDLSGKVLSGSLDLNGLDSMPDDEVIAALVQVKGIGRWSAEMFLMFRLHRPDVLPVGDLGIVNAVQRVYGLRKKPTPDRIRRIGDAWRPYRSVAAWYLWRSLDTVPVQPPTAPGKPAAKRRVPRPVAGSASSTTGGEQ